MLEKLTEALGQNSEGLVLLAYRGSVAHNTYIDPTAPTGVDDIDLMGAVVPSPRFVLGLKEWGSRGTKEIVSGPFDIVLYSLPKLVRLLSQGNPNVLSLLWVPNDLLIREYTTDLGWRLRAYKELFVGKHVFNAFNGYAYAQFKKIFAAEFQGYMGEKRKGLVLKFGYDTKNASHCVRLLRQGIEFLQTGQLNVRRADWEELVAIKTGKVTLPEVRAQIEDLFLKSKEAYESSPLPVEPQYDKIEDLLVSLMEKGMGYKVDILTHMAQ
jgi:hypothetical protein